MFTKLLRIAEVAKEKPMEKFTSLAHLINEPMLEFCYYQLSGNKASGVDGVTKAEYEAELQDNIKGVFCSFIFVPLFNFIHDIFWKCPFELNGSPCFKLFIP
jgi:hypothetical protein